MSSLCLVLMLHVVELKIRGTELKGIYSCEAMLWPYIEDQNAQRIKGE